MVIDHIDKVISHIDMGDEANDMGDDSIDTVISHIDMGYLVTRFSMTPLPGGGRKPRRPGRRRAVAPQVEIESNV
jgi:hypothetical protein